MFSALLAFNVQRAELLDEQLSEMRTDRDGQVRRLETMRKKAQEERDKSAQEMEEVKADCERQLDELRRKVSCASLSLTRAAPAREARAGQRHRFADGQR